MEKLLLLSQPQPDALALTRLSQFRYFDIAEEEVICDLNDNHEFLACFVLEGKICFSKGSEVDNLTDRTVFENELFFIPSFSACKLRALEHSRLLVHACNIVAPYLHSRVMVYLQDIDIDKVQRVDVMPYPPLMRAFLNNLVTYMSLETEIPELLVAKEFELFALFKYCFTKNQVASIFREALSEDLHFFVNIMTHYKTCRTAKELASVCGYSDPFFTSMFKKCFQGETPYQWLQKQIAREICHKLKEGKLSVKEILLDYNFKTFSHFSTFCRRNMGASPNELRK